MPDKIPPQGMGPERGIGVGKIGRKRIGPSGKGPMLERGGKSAFAGQSLGSGPSLLKKGLGPFGKGRVPNVDKDGDPFTKRPPYKKPGNYSFL